MSDYKYTRERPSEINDMGDYLDTEKQGKLKLLGVNYFRDALAREPKPESAYTQTEERAK